VADPLGEGRVETGELGRISLLGELPADDLPNAVELS